MFVLPKDRLVFPPVHMANSEGMIAIGGDLSIERLQLAYKNGIFPWYNEDDVILWWAPNPRMVLFPNEIKISKSMRKLIRSNKYTITENKAFEAVINNCATMPGRNEEGTWLHQEMIDAYIRLYEIGMAHSVEVWNDKNELAGGLYGVKTNDRVYTGESMFHKESNTSKLAFIYLAEMAQKKNIDIIDCQLHTPHLESLGARKIKRDVFMEYLK